jgi:hypothetical protein
MKIDFTKPFKNEQKGVFTEHFDVYNEYSPIVKDLT